MVTDLRRPRVDRLIIRRDLRMDVALRLALAKRPRHFRQFVRDHVLAMELRLIEHAHKNIFGKHILDDDLADVRHLDLRIHRLLRQLQKLGERPGTTVNCNCSLITAPRAFGKPAISALNNSIAL